MLTQINRAVPNVPTKIGLKEYLNEYEDQFTEQTEYLKTADRDEIKKISLCESMVPIECLEIKKIDQIDPCDPTGPTKDKKEVDFLEIYGYFDELVACPTLSHVVVILDRVASVVSQSVLIFTGI